MLYCILIIASFIVLYKFAYEFYCYIRANIFVNNVIKAALELSKQQSHNLDQSELEDALSTIMKESDCTVLDVPTQNIARKVVFWAAMNKAKKEKREK
jgi:hypothetical protein